MTTTSDNVAKKGSARTPKQEPEPKFALEDVLDPVDKIKKAMQEIKDAEQQLSGGKVLIKMERDNVSYRSPSGVLFTQEHPFQILDEGEVPFLDAGFRVATPEEVAEYYKE